MLKGPTNPVRLMLVLCTSMSFLGGSSMRSQGNSEARRVRLPMLFLEFLELLKWLWESRSQLHPDSTDHSRETGTLDKHYPEVETQQRGSVTEASNGRATSAHGRGSPGQGHLSSLLA